MKPRGVTITLESITAQPLSVLRNRAFWERVGIDVRQVQVNVVWAPHGTRKSPKIASPASRASDLTEPDAA